MQNLPFKTGHLFMALAIIMGLLTVGMFRPAAKKAPRKATEVETVNVVVPTVSISQGQTITLDDITSVKWPKAFLPKGDNTFEKPLDLSGRVARQDLFPGEPIYKQKISGSNAGGGLPAMIPDGMRAVTVAVSEIKGVAGFVKPGDRVDILSTFEVGEDDNRVTKTVLQNMLVLASAQSMVDENRYALDTPEGVMRGEATPAPPSEDEEDSKADKGKKKKAKEKSERDIEKERKALKKEKAEAEKRAKLVSSITLACTPAQAETLALAEESGDIRLVLRPETDRRTEKVSGVQFRELLGDAMPLPPKANLSVSGSVSNPTPPNFSGGGKKAGNGKNVELIQGTEKSSIGF